MFLRILKLFFVIVATFALGAFTFLHGFTAWRAGQVTVRRKGGEPFVATVDGAFPLTFATEAWTFRGRLRWPSLARWWPFASSWPSAFMRNSFAWTAGSYP